MSKGEVVISGFSGRWPKSDNLDQLWDNLKQGRPLYEKDKTPFCKIFRATTKAKGYLNSPGLFDGQFFGYTHQEAALLDAQFRILHETVYESLWDAGLIDDEWRGTRTGFFVGSFIDDMDVANDDFYQLAANRIPYVFGFTGPTYRFDTACASSLTALHEAVTALKMGQCDQAIVAGLSVHQKLEVSILGNELDLFSKTGYSRCLDAEADGYIRCEAVVSLVIQWSSQAKRMYATVLGSSTNSDGYTVNGITFPRAEAQTEVMKRAVQLASIDPLDVDYIEGHVTSTQAGDIAECSSILAAYRENSEKPIRIGCIKSNLGHAEAAAGLTSLAKVIKVLQTNLIPPNIGLKTFNPKIEGLKQGRLIPITENTSFSAKYIGINSFGFGGANSHLIVTCKAPEYKEAMEKTSLRLVFLCNRTIQGINKTMKWLQLEPKATRDDCLSLLDNISRTKVTTGMTCRGYLLLNDKRATIKQDSKLTEKLKSRLTIRLDSSVTHCLHFLSTLKPFKDSLDSSISLCSQGSHKKGEPLSAVDLVIVTYIGLIDLFNSLTICFDLFHHEDSVFYTIVNNYKQGRVSRSEAIKSFQKATRLNGKNFVQSQTSKGTDLLPFNPDSESSEFILLLGSRLSLSLNGKELFSSCGPIDGAWLETFHCSLGTLYLHGFDLKLSSLYPNYSYPVTRDCPSIGGLINWSHTVTYPHLENYLHYFEPPKRTIHRIDLLDPEYFSIGDHVIDDRVIFPATGYIYLIRKHLALTNFGPTADIFAFSFRAWKINILKAAFITEPIEFSVRYDIPSKFFEISTSGTVYVNGFAAMIKSNQSTEEKKGLKRCEDEEPNNFYYGRSLESEEMDLNGEEFYQELAILGYRYQTAFRNVLSAKITRSSAILSYTKNWIALADSFLQLEAFWSSERKLMVPTFISEARFDAEVFRDIFLSGQDVLKIYSVKPGHISTNGMLFEGIECKEFPIKGQEDRLRIGKQEFTPFMNNSIVLEEWMTKLRNKYCQMCSKALQSAVKIDSNGVHDLFDQSVNPADYSLNLMDVLNDSLDSPEGNSFITNTLDSRLSQRSADDLITLIPTEVTSPLVDLVAENVRKENKISIQNYNFSSRQLKRLIQSPFNAIGKSCHFIDERTDIAQDKPASDKPGSEVILTVYKHRSLELFGGAVRRDNLSESQIISSMRGKYSLILIRERITTIEKELRQYLNLPVDHHQSPADALSRLMKANDYLEIGSTSSEEIGLKCFLFRRRETIEPGKVNHIIRIEAGASECLWFDQLKKSLDHLDQYHRIWLVSSGSLLTGVLGLANCLALEPAFRHKIRCIFMPDKSFNERTDLSTALVERDLAVNVNLNGVWGFYRTVDFTNFNQELRSTLSEYINLQVSSKSEGRVQWVEDDAMLEKLTKDPSQANQLIKVVYGSVNFRDVLIANGKLPPNAYPVKSFYRLGLEFAGYSATGQKIMGIVGGKGFVSYIAPDHSHLLTMKVPDDWSLAQAATVPVVYMTVIYALIIRGCLQPGETVLVHAGSGGVGTAAISVCLSLGCKVYTTVSTEDKKLYVQRMFPQLTDESFADSRSTSFEETILKLTNGRGVDVVLNSLIHEKFDAGLRVLGENGRFLDLSKVDIYEDRTFDRMDLQRNVTVHAVCLATLVISQRMEIIDRIVRILEDGIADGMVKPIPHIIYHHSKVSDAFIDMYKAKHMGKVLVQIGGEVGTSTHSDTSSFRVPKVIPNDQLFPCVKKAIFNPNKSYIIVGGLGGMGLELALWLAERNVRKLIITSRSGIKTNYQRFSIRRIRSNCNTKIEISRLDVAHAKSALRLIREATKLGPVGGIFNLAVVLRDGLFPGQTLENFRTVCWPKVEATCNLDSISRQHCPHLDHFVVFSSIASQGNLGQSNYGYANSFMEKICESRRADGLPGLAIQWGPVGDVGIALRTLGDKSSIGGYEPQRIRSCLNVIDAFLRSPISVGFSAIPVLEKEESDPQDALVRVSRILGVKDVRVINLKLRLRDLGMDSVQAVEVQEYLEQNFNISLGAVSIYDLTLENLVKIASVEVKSSDFENQEVDKILRPLKTTGGRPVFFFPPAIFDFLGMLPLARSLDRQVYGIDFTDDTDLTKDWETLTDFYCARILEQWPNEQTYDFVSYSLGATFAFEVARKIQAIKGESFVRRIVFIDSTPFGIHQTFSFANKFSSKLANLNVNKEALLAFLKRMDRRQGNAWRAKAYTTTQQASNIDLTQDLTFSKYQYISQMKLEPKLKADALFFKCKHTVSDFEGSIAVHLDKSIDGHLETVMVDSNHAEIITQCKDILVSECNKFLAV